MFDLKQEHLKKQKTNWKTQREKKRLSFGVKTTKSQIKKLVDNLIKTLITVKKDKIIKIEK